MKIHQGKTKVVIVQRIFSDYREFIFNKLSDVYNFKLIHSENKTGIKQHENAYSVKIKSRQLWKIHIMNTFPTLRKIAPDVVIHEFTPSILSLYLAFIYARFFRKKIILWGHGLNRIKGKSISKKISLHLRILLLKRADGILVYGQEGKKELSEYINSEKIFVAQNTLDTDNLITIRQKLESIGTDRVKSDLSIRNKYNIVFTGRLLKSKKPELLLEIYEQLKEKYDIGIHIIGDGEQKELILKKIKEKKYTDIYCHGSIHSDEEIGKYLYCADLMIIPGYLGLAINHAFCFDTPVVSFGQTANGPFHSPEIEYLAKHKTGYLAKDLEDMIDFISTYLSNKTLKVDMQREIRNCVNTKCSTANMLKGFTDSIDYVLNKP